MTFIANSPRGPQIVALGPIIGVQFLITPRWPDTCTVLASWLMRMADSLRNCEDLETCPDVLGLEVIALPAGGFEAQMNRQSIAVQRASNRLAFEGYADLADLAAKDDERLPPDYKEFTKHEVRPMLHPELVREDESLIRPESAPIRTVVQRPGKKAYCRWKDFQGKENNYSTDSALGRNYVCATPSEPPMNHAFREFSTDKWVGGAWR